MNKENLHRGVILEMRIRELEEIIKLSGKGGCYAAFAQSGPFFYVEPNVSLALRHAAMEERKRLLTEFENL